MANRYDQLTLQSALSLEETNLVLPVMGMFSRTNWRNIEIGAKEYLLPPVYRECMSNREIDQYAEIVRRQLPHYDSSESTRIRVLEVPYDEDTPQRLGDVIFGIDPLEQHGPHLNLATDYQLSAAYIDDICREYEDLEKLNPLYLGSMRWGAAIGGSIATPEDWLDKVVRSYFQEILSAGAKRIVVISTHLAPNHMAVIDEIVADMEDVKIHVIAPLKYLSETDYDCHAGMVETAMSFFLGLPVKTDVLRKIDEYGRIYSKKYIEGISHLSLDGLTHIVHEDAWNGIVGRFDSLDQKDICSSLKNKGRVFYQEIVEKMSEEIKGFLRT